jgi:factor associated with neutral sphingomyelinase activation
MRFSSDFSFLKKQNIALWKNNGSVSLRDDISSASSRLQMTLRSHVNQHPSFHSGLQQPLHPLNLYPHETETGVNFTCFFMTPLVHTPGCCVLGKEHLYFQPWRGPWDAILSHSSKWTESIGVPPKASFWTVSSIVATARRYHGLRDVALEIFFNTGPSILLAFPTWKDREWVLEHLSEPRLSYTPNGPSQIRPSKIPCHTDVIFMEQALLAWLQGTIDNFQYLLLINSASGRTFHDLSRYPVFPWVIADYASPHLDCGTFFSPFSKAKKDFIVEYKTVFRDLQKPVGALNEQRLEYFQTRYKNMQDMEHAFLYGTHFSAPGYVLYFLVRMMPEHMLCLQNGILLLVPFYKILISLNDISLILGPIYRKI